MDRLHRSLRQAGMPGHRRSSSRTLLGVLLAIGLALAAPAAAAGGVVFHGKGIVLEPAFNQAPAAIVCRAAISPHF